MLAAVQRWWGSRRAFRKLRDPQLDTGVYGTSDSYRIMGELRDLGAVDALIRILNDSSMSHRTRGLAADALKSATDPRGIIAVVVAGMTDGGTRVSQGYGSIAGSQVFGLRPMAAAVVGRVLAEDATSETAE